MLEIAFALAMVFLYIFEIDRGLYPPGIVVSSLELHMQFLSHATLIALMTAASFIDIDEKIIPDAIRFPERFWVWLRNVVSGEPFACLGAGIASH